MANDNAITPNRQELSQELKGKTLLNDQQVNSICDRIYLTSPDSEARKFPRSWMPALQNLSGFAKLVRQGDVVFIGRVDQGELIPLRNPQSYLYR